MTLQYGQVLHYLPDFLLGAGMALWIAALAFAGLYLIPVKHMTPPANVRLEPSF